MFWLLNINLVLNKKGYKQDLPGSLQENVLSKKNLKTIVIEAYLNWP